MSSGNNDKDSDDYHLSYDGERGPKWRKFSREPVTCSPVLVAP